MLDFIDLQAVVDGKRIVDWLKSDEGLVDYKKCELGKNVSNTKGIIIFDLGEFEHDPDVRETRYCNGVDLARVAGVVQYGVPYKGMSMKTAFDGDDYVRIFYNSFANPTIQEFIMYFYRIIGEDIYISETNHHVFVKGRSSTDEEWKAAVHALYEKSASKQ